MRNIIKEQSILRKLKLQLSVAYFLLGAVLASGVFFFWPQINGIAQALTGTYNKITGDQLTIADWNNLDNDFVAKSGDTMGGDLNMGGHTVTNLPNPVNNTDATSKNYVDSAIDSSGGGDTFVNWGRGDCPTGSDIIYTGFSYASRWSLRGGSTDPICLKTDYEPGGPGVDYSNELYPLETGQASTIPSDMNSASSEKKNIKCALCYAEKRTCFDNWGGWTCDGGSTSVYDGWMFGQVTNPNRESQVNSFCLNRDLDKSITSNIQSAAAYGSTVNHDGDPQPDNLYSDNTFIRCSKCCK